MTDSRASGFCDLMKVGDRMQPSVNLVNFSIKIICIDWKCWLLWISVSCELDRTQYFYSITDACEIEWFLEHSNELKKKKKKEKRKRTQQYVIWLNFSLTKWLTTSDTFSWEIIDLANKIWDDTQSCFTLLKVDMGVGRKSMKRLQI